MGVLGLGLGEKREWERGEADGSLGWLRGTLVKLDEPWKESAPTCCCCYYCCCNPACPQLPSAEAASTGQILFSELALGWPFVTTAAKALYSRPPGSSDAPAPVLVQAEAAQVGWKPCCWLTFCGVDSLKPSAWC